jgi:hypothetical protein
MAKTKLNPEKVREACAAHRTLRAAAAALGTTPAHLSRWRRKLGLIERDAVEKSERERAALQLSTSAAAAALGCTEQHIYRLRARARERAKETTAT